MLIILHIVHEVIENLATKGIRVEEYLNTEVYYYDNEELIRVEDEVHIHDTEYVYNEIGGYHFGYTAARRGDKWCMLEYSKRITSLKYDYLGQVGYGLAVAQIGDKWGIVLKDKEILPVEHLVRFECFDYFDEDGIFEIWIDGETGFIYKDGFMLVPCDSIEKFKEVRAGSK